jgi:hypothetical protein
VKRPFLAVRCQDGAAVPRGASLGLILRRDGSEARKRHLRVGGRGGEGESEARGRFSGERVAVATGSDFRWERRFFLRGPTGGGVAVSRLKASSRARRVDSGSASQSSQPPSARASSACSRPRQRAQITWRSPSLSGALHEPHEEKRDIFKKTLVLF